jgi:hypothetical protein
MLYQAMSDTVHFKVSDADNPRMTLIDFAVEVLVI